MTGCACVKKTTFQKSGNKVTTQFCDSQRDHCLTDTSHSLHITFTVIFEAGYVNRLWRRMGCSRILEDTLLLHFRIGDLHITSTCDCKSSNCDCEKREVLSFIVSPDVADSARKG